MAAGWLSTLPSSSPRDGGITHLGAVGVILADSGAEEIKPVSAHPERIYIFEPAVTDSISGGVAHVEGYALASFEQPLVVEVRDEAGQVAGSQAVIVTAPDLGVLGAFTADMPYTVMTDGPGRIIVGDPLISPPPIRGRGWGWGRK